MRTMVVVVPVDADQMQRVAIDPQLPSADVFAVLERGRGIGTRQGWRGRRFVGLQDVDIIASAAKGGRGVVGGHVC